MSNRHARGLYTPGSQTLEVDRVNYNRDIQDKADALEAKRRGIQAQITATNQELNRILTGIGQSVIENGGWKGDMARAGKLRLEIEALDQAVLFIDGQIGLLRRNNAWLKR